MWLRFDIEKERAKNAPEKRKHYERCKVLVREIMVAFCEQLGLDVQRAVAAIRIKVKDQTGLQPTQDSKVEREEERKNCKRELEALESVAKFQKVGAHLDRRDRLPEALQQKLDEKLSGMIDTVFE